MKLIAKLILIALLVTATAGTLFGQTASKALERIARDQQNIKQRLDRINEKMDRLVKKNELEGKQHTADLIRRARAAIGERNIPKRIEDLDQKIRDAQLTVDEEQQALLKDLEDIFAILQDRNDLERVQDLIASLMEGIRKIDDLIGEQDQLLEKTRSMNRDETSRLSANLKRLKEIIEGQEELAEASAGLDEEIKLTVGSEEDGNLSEREKTEATRPLAGRQDFLESEMRSLKEKMAQEAQQSPGSDQGERSEQAEQGEQGEQAERSEKDKTAESGERKDLERAEAALREMKEAQNDLKAGEPGESIPHQQAALEQLKAMERQMQEARDQSAAKQDSADQAQREQEFRELAEQQKQLEERTRDLMRRLRELPDPAMRQHLADSADNMAGASTALQENQGEQAETDQEEARKHLEKAMKNLVREENKYQNIRQQEVLFRVRQALEAVKVEQDALNEETAEIDLTRGDARRLNRLERKTVRTLSRRELDVRVKTTEIREKLEEDEATVFSWVLERNVQDLDEVVDFLNQQKTDPLVQNIQRDISDRFAELIESLKLEMKRRSEAAAESEEENASPQDQQSGQNPLIPPVAELLMIKRLEENSLRRLNEFVRLNPELLDEGAGPFATQLLERLGHRHANITDLFTRMVERAGGNPVSPEPPAEEEK